MRESTSRLPSAEQPDPLSLVLLMRVLRAASAMSAVSSMTIVALPAPTPYAGLPDPYAALTIAGPPVARVRSHVAISSLASGMLGRSTDCRMSSGAPSRPQRLAHQPDHFVGGAAARRVRREDDGVLAFDRVDGDADRRHVGAGDGNERGNDAGGLGVLDDPLLGNLLDDPHALLPQRVAQDAQGLAAAAGLRTAQAALPDAHLRQTRRRDLVRGRPRDGLTETIHRRADRRKRWRSSPRAPARAAPPRAGSLRGNDSGAHR